MNPIRTNPYDDDVLLCPRCGEDSTTHIDAVHISARREDDMFHEIHVDAITGEVRTDMPPGPAGERVGMGRRQRLTLLGYCECCGPFAFVFTQHKGATYVELVP